jgi:nicotinamide-nucleotide amidase
MSEPAEALVSRLAAALLARGAAIAVAESCTGGLVAAACTSLAGSSAWFERGIVSYSNAAKEELLGVPAALIEAHGAVSPEVAEALARENNALLRALLADRSGHGRLAEVLEEHRRGERARETHHEENA